MLHWNQQQRSGRDLVCLQVICRRDRLRRSAAGLCDIPDLLRLLRAPQDDSAGQKWIKSKENVV